ncbi:HAD-IA family hydrolase [Candidatus Woesearchaeota archaeon]|nr:HAD-IA family hydrolase [Candidatus Woesearchaeota archaeon]
MDCLSIYTMIKGVIFDFWGTLVEQGTYSPLRQTYKILRVRMPFSPFVVKFENVFMTKKYEDQATAFREVCKAFNIDCKPFVVDKLIGIWNSCKLLAKPYPETLQVLKDLKDKGLKLAVSSNSPYNNVEPVLEKFDMEKYFDRVNLSWETGKLKHESESFESILRKMNLKHGEVLMVGDSLETDIAGAEKVGIKAVLVDRKGRREYKNKIKDLSELNQFL